MLVVPRTEPFGFTRVSEVNVNARVTGIQMYRKARVGADCRLPETDGRFEEI